ncbi:hypothetical protein TNCV_3332021 [Trichonephila clavipes]|nr:hypothetical protein TNCV_3332021 [Trichonephila clavipes]
MHLRNSQSVIAPVAYVTVGEPLLEIHTWQILDKERESSSAMPRSSGEKENCQFLFKMKMELHVSIDRKTEDENGNL